MISFFALSSLSVAVACTLLVIMAALYGKSRTHIRLLVFNIFCVIWGAGCFVAGIATSSKESIIGWQIALFGGYFVAPAFLHFIYEFSGQKNNRLLSFAYIQAGFYSFLSLLFPQYFYKTRYVFGIYYNDATLFYTIGVGFYLFFLFYAYWQLIQYHNNCHGLKKTQTRYIALGFFFGFLGGTSTFLPMFGIDAFYPGGNIGIVIYCLFLSYAILQHRLMEFRVAFSHISAYFIASLGLFTLYFSFLRWVEISFSSQLVHFFLFLLMVLIFHPFKNQMKRILEFVLNMDSVNYNETMQNIGKKLASNVDLKSIHKLVVEDLFQALSIKDGILFHRQGKEFVAVGSSDRNAAPPSLDSSIIVALNEKSILVKDEHLISHGVEKTKILFMDLPDKYAEVVAVIKVDGEISHLLCLGEKKSNEAFSAIELNLLETVINQASVSIKNALLHIETQDMAKEWRDTFYTINDAITIHDVGFKTIRANLAAINLLNINEEDSWSQSLKRIVNESLNESILAHGIEIFDEVLEKHLEVKVLPRRNSNQEVSGYINIARDISDRIKLVQEKDEVQEQLVQSAKLATVGTMASSIAHELNNPLFAVEGFAGLIVEDVEGQEDIKESAEKIVLATDKMRKIIDHMRNFSRQSKPEDWKQISINDVIHSSLVLLESQLKSHGINLNLNLETNIPLIWGDAVQLESVVQNFITNSRDSFGDLEDKREKQIHIITRQKQSNLEVIYQDNANGMTKETMDKIFKTFYTTKEVGKGTGLGMSISYDIIQHHKGEIRVESAVGEGSQFVLVFPVLQGEVYLEQEQEQLKKEQKEFVSEKSSVKPKILLIDDDEDITGLLFNFLEDSFESICINDPLEAINSIKNNEFNLIVSDLKMDKYTGLDILKVANEHQKSTPVLIHTAYSKSDQLVKKAIQLGAAEIIPKDVNSFMRIIDYYKKNQS